MFDSDAVVFEWEYKENAILKVHHTGIFYKILNYKNDIKKEISIDTVNDDSLGGDWYENSKLTREELSDIAILELEKLGYSID